MKAFERKRIAEHLASKVEVDAETINQVKVGNKMSESLYGFGRTKVPT